MADNYEKLPNLKAETAHAYGSHGTIGCLDTKSDVMLSFGGLVPYGGDNRPSGKIDPLRIVDVFLDRAAAERLHQDLAVALGEAVYQATRFSAGEGVEVVRSYAPGTDQHCWRITNAITAHGASAWPLERDIYVSVKEAFKALEKFRASFKGQSKGKES